MDKMYVNMIIGSVDLSVPESIDAVIAKASAWRSLVGSDEVSDGDAREVIRASLKKRLAYERSEIYNSRDGPIVKWSVFVIDERSGNGVQPWMERKRFVCDVDYDSNSGKIDIVYPANTNMAYGLPLELEKFLMRGISADNLGFPEYFKKLVDPSTPLAEAKRLETYDWAQKDYFRALTQISVRG